MKECPNCHHIDLNTMEYCVKCGTKMEMRYAEATADTKITPTDLYGQSNILSPYNRIVCFMLYVICIFLPVLGLLLAILISLTPFSEQKILSSNLIKCSGICFLIQFVLGLIIGFVSGFFQGFFSAIGG